jgi:hypothetical protein
MDPEGFDLRPAIELFGQLVELYFADRRTAAGTSTDEAPQGA